MPSAGHGSRERGSSRAPSSCPAGATEMAAAHSMIPSIKSWATGRDERISCVSPAPAIPLSGIGAGDTRREPAGYTSGGQDKPGILCFPGAPTWSPSSFTGHRALAMTCGSWTNARGGRSATLGKATIRLAHGRLYASRPVLTLPMRSASSFEADALPHFTCRSWVAAWLIPPLRAVSVVPLTRRLSSLSEQ